MDNNPCLYADALRADREETARVMKKDSVKGIWDSIKDKYTDKGHFVYELLQNADDAGATKATFELYQDDVGDNGRLIFRHNGTKHFFTSDPTSGVESQDKRDNRLGSVNAITSVAQSNKTTNSIGKFGVGFKSVFHYTLSPIIYDEGIRFRIVDYIVPDFDIPEYSGSPARVKGETIFIIPFNRPANESAQIDGKMRIPTKKECYEEIKERIVSLKMPTLFLTNLRLIAYKCFDASGRMAEDGEYSSSVKENGVADGICYSFVRYDHRADSSSEVRHLWMFSLGSGVEGRCVVAFMANENKSIVNVDHAFYAQCFFPTKEDMGLRFLAHAPFLLTESREGIVDDQHNTALIQRLAQLTSRAIELLAGFRTADGTRIYDEESVNVFPIREDVGQDAQRFKPFFESTIKLFQQSCVVPSSTGYASKSNVVVAASLEMRKLFSNTSLRELLGRNDIEWAFPNVNMRSNVDEQRDVINFINKIGLEKVSDKDVIARLSSSFMQKQGVRWCKDLHKWIWRDVFRRDSAKTAPIFFNDKNEVVAAFDNKDDHILYLPLNNKSVPGYETISQEMLACAETAQLVKAYGIPPPSAKEMLLKFVNDDAANGGLQDHLDWFVLIMQNYQSLASTDRKAVVERLKKRPLLAVDASGQEMRMLPKDLYFPDEELKDYFGIQADVSFLNIDAYANATSESADMLRGLFVELGVVSLPRLKEVPLKCDDFSRGYMEARGPWKKQTGYIQDPETWTEYEFEGMRGLLNRIESELDSLVRRHLVETCWKVLNRLVADFEDNRFSTKLTQGQHKYKHYGVQTEEFENYLLFQLKNAKWLIDMENNPVSAADVTLQRLNGMFMEDSVIANSIRAELGIKNDASVEAVMALSPDDRQMLERARQLSKMLSETGESIEDIMHNADLLKSTLARAANPVDNVDGGRNMSSKEAKPREQHAVLGLSNELETYIRNIPRPVNARGSEDSGDTNDFAKIMTVTELLGMKLHIPWYQRPYEWQERNVIELLDDISEAGRAEKSAYRIGSIILRHDESSKRYDIVDGQQRTLTLVLLCCALARLVHGVEVPTCLSDSDFYPALDKCRVSRRNMRNNFVAIDGYLREHDTADRIAQTVLKRLQVVVISVKSQPEAFLLFDSQNSRGRRLEPHDLLKAYHLRVAKGLPATCVMQAVEKWEAHQGVEISKLFADGLHRIYRWSRMEKEYGFSAKDIGVFKGVPVNWTDRQLPVVSEYSYAERVKASKGCFQIGEPFVPGLDFFKMVEHYFGLQKKISCKIASCSSVSDTLEKVRKNKGVAYADRMFMAALLCYFDRFGIAQSDPEIAIAKLFKWAFAVRVDLEYLGPKTPNKYALGGDGDYTNRIAMFAAIKNARVHSEITNMMINVGSKSAMDNWQDLRNALARI